MVVYLITSSNHQVLNNCALAVCALGRFDRALEFFQAALSKEGGESHALVTRNMQLIEEVADRGVVNPTLFNPQFLNDQGKVLV